MISHTGATAPPAALPCLVLFSQGKPTFHTVYDVRLIANRMHQLQALENGCDTAPCVYPRRKRDLTLWPYYFDDTALGEKYAEPVHVHTMQDWDKLEAAAREPGDAGGPRLIVLDFYAT